jgi:hypothetical protein
MTIGTMVTIKARALSQLCLLLWGLCAVEMKTTAFQTLRTLPMVTKPSSLFRSLRTPVFNSQGDPAGMSRSSSENSSRSLLKLVDEAGQGLKPKAVKANAKAMLTDARGQKLIYVLQSCLLFSLFIVYRAYRGIFVILPAVFRQVYQKMENIVDRPFDDDSSVSAPKEPSTLRTRITVSLVAGVVTISYVVAGAVGVLFKFIRTMTATSDVSGSFAAAADEQEQNEDKISRLTRNESKAINGERDRPADSSFPADNGLAP